jgi:hypothetical protein
MAVVLIVSSTAGARAEQIDEGVIGPSSTVQERPYVPFVITPAMVRSLSDPAEIPPSRTLTQILPGPPAHASKSAGNGGAKVVAGVAFGLIGTFTGAAIGAKTGGEAGGFYGVMIGAPLGAWLGVWLAGK